MEQEPQELIEQASRGDAEAIEALLERYLPTARAVVRRRMGAFLRRKEESQDVVQSVCRRVLEQKEIYEHRGTEEFQAWLLEIVDRIVDHFRMFTAQRRDARREENGEGRAGGAPSDRLDQLPGNEAGPRTHAARDEAIEAVREALEALPRELASALRLHEFEGCSYEKIAEELGVTYKQARRLVQQAKMQMGRRLRP